MGVGSRGRRRLCPSGREAVARTERLLDSHRFDLDKVVSYHQTQELSVSSPFLLHCRPFSFFLGNPIVVFFLSHLEGMSCGTKNER